jgi:hypothetical protein
MDELTNTYETITDNNGITFLIQNKYKAWDDVFAKMGYSEPVKLGFMTSLEAQIKIEYPYTIFTPVKYKIVDLNNEAKVVIITFW